MKIYFVVNARMPSEKAHGIHIAKMCEALIEAGHNVALVTPLRGKGSLKAFYDLRVEVPRVRLWSLVLHRYERIGFALMSATFMFSYMVFLWWKRMQGEQFVLYTVDIDTFSHALLPLCGCTVAEMHSPKSSTILSRFFFKRARIVATNKLITDELSRTFGLKHILIEPNGVDISGFDIPDKQTARRTLGLGDGPLALYVGRFYKWKGLEVLAGASAALAPQGISLLALGGTKDEFVRVFNEAGEIQFAEARPHEVPLWLAAADVLLVIGTKRNADSDRYTTPMKVFEYFSAGRPVVASATEALKSTIPQHMAVFVEPDNAQSLAEAVQTVVAQPADFVQNVEAAQALAREHTWSARAQRIMRTTFHHD